MLHTPLALLLCGVFAALSVIQSSNIAISPEDESRIRKEIDTLEEKQRLDVLNGNVDDTAALMAEDIAVNAPDNRVHRKAEITNMMKQHTGLQYTQLDVHREAIVIRPDLVETMGYEVVVPKGNVPNAGKKVTRRYINIYIHEAGRWRLIGRQATNISIED